MDKTNKILEALKMQPLSEEEKTSRHILGRLYGPIATSLESTRNGRKYNNVLWERALSDEIFREKVANKSLFLELGHPADREETDMSKVCACIPEMPKIVDGDLYAYVDILDTPNGKLLKTFCDYGFIPGISSRGSGDIMANDEVDPETFFLETWDIVQLPAVKKARLAMCESIDTETLKLKKALVESYNNSTEEDKKLMKEALDNLNISLDEDAEFLPGGTPTNIDDIPWGAEEIEESTKMTLSEDTDEEIEEPVEETEETPEDTEEVDEEETPEEENTEEPEDIGLTAVEDVAEVVEDAIEAEKIEEEDVEDEHDQGYNDGLDKANEVVEDTITEIINSEQPEDEESAGEDKETDSDDEEVPEADEAEDSAEDDGENEVIESLKEMIRQKTALENEVKTLKSEKTVGDAKVKTLEEELNKYKTAFMRVSELASKSTKFEAEAKALNEQLSAKDVEIKALTEKVAKATKLTESVNNDSTQVKRLTEKLASMQTEAEANEAKLTEQVSQYKQLAAKRTETAKAYKAKYETILEGYLKSKATMLGVRTSDITSRLPENYTMDNIDEACDAILTEKVGMARLPFGNTAKVQINESKTNASVKRRTNPDDDYDFDSLLELAGLK